jgi:hypothetical protein
MQKESGLSIERWCRENHISPHTFYYWRDSLFPKPLPSHLNFAELSNAKETGIVIECGNLRIRLDRHFDPSILKQCLVLLMEIKC